MSWSHYPEMGRIARDLTHFIINSLQD
ncbi:two-component system connector SafA [Escherichia coli]